MIISYSALCKTEVLRLETRPDGVEEYVLQHEETKGALKKIYGLDTLYTIVEK